MDRKEEVRISKILSYILRHGAIKEKLELGQDGFIKVSDLLARPKLKGVTMDQIQYIVTNNDKQRFCLRLMNTDNNSNNDDTTDNDNNNKTWYIRANQGHSLAQVNDVELTREIQPLDIVVHGTTTKNWVLIQQSQGLSKMNRNHIHCAVGLPGDQSVISGMRSSSQVLIYIDMEKALQDGIAFYRSSNNVILTDGLNGILPQRYFKQVTDRDGNSLV